MLCAKEIASLLVVSLKKVVNGILHLCVADRWKSKQSTRRGGIV